MDFSIACGMDPIWFVQCDLLDNVTYSDMALHLHGRNAHVNDMTSNFHTRENLRASIKATRVFEQTKLIELRQFI